MKYVTYEERFKKAAAAAKTRREYDDLVAAIMADLMKTEEGLYVIDKRWKSYGTWKVTVWLNTAEFGEELKRYVADNFRIITHDEEREWKTLDDIYDEFYDCVTDYAFELF